MTQPELLRKLQTMLDEAKTGELWGTIEIEIRKGVPMLLYKKIGERLNTEDYPRARNHT